MNVPDRVAPVGSAGVLPATSPADVGGNEPEAVLNCWLVVEINDLALLQRSVAGHLDDAEVHKGIVARRQLVG